MHRGPPQLRVDALSEGAVQLAERRQDRARLDDRVDAEVGPRAVGRPADDLNLTPDKPLVGGGDLQFRGFGDNGCVGPDRAQNLLHAQARLLFVGNRCDRYVPGKPQLGRLAAGDQRCRDSALHVIGAAPVQPIALDARSEWPAHSLNPDGVHVAAE